MSFEQFEPPRQSGAAMAEDGRRRKSVFRCAGLLQWRGGAVRGVAVRRPAPGAPCVCAGPSTLRFARGCVPDGHGPSCVRARPPCVAGWQEDRPRGVAARGGRHCAEHARARELRLQAPPGPAGCAGARAAAHTACPSRQAAPRAVRTRARCSCRPVFGLPSTLRGMLSGAAGTGGGRCQGAGDQQQAPPNGRRVFAPRQGCEWRRPMCSCCACYGRCVVAAV